MHVHVYVLHLPESEMSVEEDDAEGGVPELVSKSMSTTAQSWGKGDLDSTPL